MDKDNKSGLTGSIRGKFQERADKKFKERMERYLEQKNAEDRERRIREEQRPLPTVSRPQPTLSRPHRHR